MRYTVQNYNICLIDRFGLPTTTTLRGKWHDAASRAVQLADRHDFTNDAPVFIATAIGTELQQYRVDELRRETGSQETH